MRKTDHIAIYIKSVRKHLGLSQAEFAEQINSNRANVANYESGRTIPPGDVLLEIQKIERVSKDKAGASAPLR